jgi:hypothetical protein
LGKRLINEFIGNREEVLYERRGRREVVGVGGEGEGGVLEVDFETDFNRLIKSKLSNLFSEFLAKIEPSREYISKMNV